MQSSYTISYVRRTFNWLALLGTILLLGITDLQGQLTLSPYSRYGVGSLDNPVGTRNFSMGGLGIGASDPMTINRINPASYSDLKLTTIDINGFGTYSIQKSDLNTASLNTAGFRSVSLGFSNRKGFGLVAGIAPYSSTGYNVITRDSVIIDSAYSPYSTSYSANGGLNQFYLGFGVRVLKNFRAGANMTLAFGNQSLNWTNDFDEPAYANVNAERRTTLNGLLPQIGVQYADTIRIRTTVERSKLINENIKDLDAILKKVNSEEERVLAEGKKLSAWESKTQAKVDEYAAEKKSLNSEVDVLMADEETNKKAISKLQEKVFRIEKKRKKLVREIKTKTRYQKDALARLGSRRRKINDKKTNLLAEIEEIKEGKRSATTERNRTFNVHVGAIVEPASKLNGSSLLTYDNTIVTDTLYDLDGSVKIPLRYGIGFSIVRPRRWSLGIDAALQNWSNFQYFNDVNTLDQALSVRLGGEWIPDILASKYRNRIAYRAGFHYQNTSIITDGNPVSEIGFSVGMGLPIGRFNPISLDFSRINIGFGVSKVGNLNSNPLEELNFNFRLGVNLSEIWFIKRRID